MGQKFLNGTKASPRGFLFLSWRVSSLDREKKGGELESFFHLVFSNLNVGGEKKKDNVHFKFVAYKFCLPIFFTHSSLHPKGPTSHKVHVLDSAVHIRGHEND